MGTLACTRHSAHVTTGADPDHLHVQCIAKGRAHTGHTMRVLEACSSKAGPHT